jgi:hypothetical protein
MNASLKTRPQSRRRMICCFIWFSSAAGVPDRSARRITATVGPTSQKGQLEYAAVPWLYFSARQSPSHSSSMGVPSSNSRYSTVRASSSRRTYPCRAACSTSKPHAPSSCCPRFTSSCVNALPEEDFHPSARSSSRLAVRGRYVHSNAMARATVRVSAASRSSAESEGFTRPSRPRSFAEAPSRGSTSRTRRSVCVDALLWLP